MGATFAATKAAVANTRETEDSMNSAAGACAAGFLAGIRGMPFQPYIPPRNVLSLYPQVGPFPWQ
jgi:hypothetical protein